MLVAERWQRIVQLVNERGSIRVTELSELCQVTEETIRRDLDRLESEGKLMRSHGGAVSVKEAQSEVPFLERETAHADFKNSIAKEAVSHIREGDRIILDASTTAWYMAKLIPDMPLTIITNSMKVALEVSGKEKIQVISTGGLLSPRSLSYVGPLAERSLDMYHVHKLFLSCKGVHIQRGISESTELQALIKRKMISIADETYLLADHSKFGMQSLTQVASWPEIKHVITDGQTPKEDVDRIRDKGVHVIQLDKE
ncbi:DeoR/GlpR family DNA-binding transcription regulator [Paenibacillus sp. GCM10023248]|uniref:DeoR/GlpR family DNA-binding transcription regulator n=1 Tax=Bacillales TaxID=1385 RepID=UPI002377EE15|nr:MULTISPECIES: DeoR/GlpR family DNA-binding transcription regulator [Bacillales]MDD9265849.1 DeoR/GlpR family DNA-binding transcription regulator [Paenibacillus sp. MAHUQ-63]MDR6879089.1 DeoR/GlpR family transcriptional regulator of sugar metabolism [Bacillus sp. 3255]